MQKGFFFVVLLSTNISHAFDLRDLEGYYVCPENSIKYQVTVRGSDLVKAEPLSGGDYYFKFDNIDGPASKPRKSADNPNPELDCLSGGTVFTKFIQKDLRLTRDIFAVVSWLCLFPFPKRLKETLDISLDAEGVPVFLDYTPPHNYWEMPCSLERAQP